VYNKVILTHLLTYVARSSNGKGLGSTVGAVFDSLSLTFVGQRLVYWHIVV